VRGKRPLASFGLVLLSLAASAQEDVRVVASKEGFKPKVVNVRKGEGLRLLLSSSDGEHCFALEAFRVEKRILPDKTTTVDLVPDRTGTFPFYCCLETGAAAEKEHGRLVVTD
jgi:heme/copper-type cytochrome/quinol oxidase subunit 2